MTQQTIVIKVGTAVLSTSDGQLNDGIIQQLVAELADLKAAGHQVILISSGAVGAGRPLLERLNASNETQRRQVLSAIGQVGLINRYAQQLQPHNLVPAQILVTKKDFESRQHYLNMRDCLEASLQQSEVLPIVNENDTVATAELMFTDNDELASLIAAMLNADRLIILTSAPGLMTGDPTQPDAKLISEVDPSLTPLESFQFRGQSHGGRGGMATKCRFAYLLSRLGITTHIVNGHQPDNIAKVVRGEAVGTRFVPQRRQSSAKRWLAYAGDHPSSHIVIDDGARETLLSTDVAASLLLIGVKEIHGNFEAGDTIYIKDTAGQTIGWGRSSLSSHQARQLLPQARQQKPLIHYDYLHLNLG